MIHLLAITPLCVDDAELTRRQIRYNRLAPQSIDVKLLNLGNESHIPRALNTQEDIEASEAALLERFREAESSDRYGQVDGFLPDCVLDPVVGRTDTGLDTPIFGLLQLSSHLLVSLGATVGAVARNEPIARELDRKFASYGLGVPHGTTSVLGLSVQDIADDRVWADALSTHLQSVTADYVINGCSAVEIADVRTRTTIIDPTAMGLQVLSLIDAADAFPGGRKER